MILLEQPEIHLHPRSQGVLGDLLIDIVNSGRQVMIETHSEHVIGRIQTSIAQGHISNDQVVIYYFQPTDQGTEIREVALNDRGQFETEGLPEDFFAQGYEESVRHMNVIADRIRGELNGG